MRLKLFSVSSDRFTYSKGTFSAEASDFKGDDVLNQRIFDDACDEGFNLRSVKTGKVETFIYTKEIFTGQGEDREVAGWEYKPLDKILRDCGVKVIIWND